MGIMTKAEFLGQLRGRLFGLPPMEIEERLMFYSEMIEDRIEEGLSEEEAVAEVGNIDDIVHQIISEIPLSRIIRGNTAPRHKFKGWEIALLILGAPLWIPLVIAAFAVVLSLYITLWALVISLFAVVLALALAAVCSIPAAVFYARAGDIAGVVFFIGCSLACTGMTILFAIISVLAAKGAAKLAQKIMSSIKSAYIGKEVA